MSERIHRVPTFVGPVLLVVGVLLLTRQAFFGGGADMAHHYWLASFLQDTFAQHSRPDYTAGGMSTYPAGSHALAAMVGLVLGSPFLGLHVVSVMSVTLIWLAVAGFVSMLSGPARWVAATVLGVTLLLAVGVGHLQVHGHELVINYFYAQLVGLVAFWLLALRTAVGYCRGRGHLRLALPLAVGAVLITFVHASPAVHLLVLLGLVSLVEVVRRQREELAPRSVLTPLVLPPVTALFVAAMPGFRAMRALSTNDGALEIPYFDTIGRVVLLAAVVCLLAVTLLAGAWRERQDRRTQAVLLVGGLTGFSLAVPALLQALVLAADEGSPYAVKKYVFALTTSMLLSLALLAGQVTARLARDERPARGLVQLPVASLLALVAVAAVFERPAIYDLSAVLALEEDVRLADRALTPGVEAGQAVYAVDLPGSDPPLDYMFSLAPLGAPGPDELGIAVLTGQTLPATAAGARLMTSAASPYAQTGCSTAGPVGSVVVVEGACYLQDVERCKPLRLLGREGDAGTVLVSGWHLPERNARWTSGTVAQVRCVLPEVLADQEEVIVELRVAAFTGPGVERQRVTLRGHGRQQAYVLDQEQPPALLQLTVPLPASGVLEVEVLLPDATSPHAIGISNDRRVLGLHVSSLAVR